MSNRNETDPHRRLAAAHELGHWLAFRTAKISCHPPRLIGHGKTTHGYVALRGDLICRTTHDMHKWLTAILAGPAAGDRWGQLPGEIPQQPHQCDIDLTEVRTELRQPLARGLTLPNLHRDARALVHRHWPEIQRLVPRLARTGHL